MRFGTGEIIVLVLILLLLFGAKKLPETARGLGRSLRILKAETKGLHDDDEVQTTPVVPSAPPQATPTASPMTAPPMAQGSPTVPATPQSPPVPPVQQQLPPGSSVYDPTRVQRASEQNPYGS